MYGLVTQIDHQIGVIIGQLREEGLLKNTLIIFTSDHGDMMFDHGALAKSLPFQGSANVPFIAVPPLESRSTGKLNRTCDLPVGLEDVMPTILNYCGVKIPASVEGRSLKGLIQGKSPSKWREVMHIVIRDRYAVTDNRFKYCWFGDNGTELLFNLVDDPRECKDLSKDKSHAKVLKKYRSRLIELLKERRDPALRGGKLVSGKKSSSLSPNNLFVWNNRGWNH
jgi:arylsulfatase A-like enzyme